MSWRNTRGGGLCARTRVSLKGVRSSYSWSGDSLLSDSPHSVSGVLIICEPPPAAMVPLIGEDEEVEAASFMPPAFRGSADNVLRKWRAGDVVVKAVDAQIGGGTFGEGWKKFFVRHVQAVAAQIVLHGWRAENDVPDTDSLLLD